jgi:hypothetical protein
LAAVRPAISLGGHRNRSEETSMANKDKGGAKDSKKAPKKNLKEKRKEKKLKKEK